MAFEALYKDDETPLIANSESTKIRYYYDSISGGYFPAKYYLENNSLKEFDLTFSYTGDRYYKDSSGNYNKADYYFNGKDYEKIQDGIETSEPKFYKDPSSDKYYHADFFKRNNEYFLLNQTGKIENVRQYFSDLDTEAKYYLNNSSGYELIDQSESYSGNRKHKITKIDISLDPAEDYTRRKIYEHREPFFDIPCMIFTTYNSCNPFGLLSGDFGDNINSIPKNASEEESESFNKLYESFMTLKSYYKKDIKYISDNDDIKIRRDNRFE